MWAKQYLKGYTLYDLSQPCCGGRTEDLGYHKMCSLAQIYVNTGDVTCATYPTGDGRWTGQTGAWSGGSNVCAIACQD